LYGAIYIDYIVGLHGYSKLADPFAEIDVVRSASKRYFCAKKLTVCRSENTTHNLLKMTFIVRPLPCNFGSMT